MLSEITIKDFAIIDHLTLQFEPGFNVLTGETGAGKSIILDAVSMLLGARADTAFVRAGAKSAMVEGVFTITNPLLEDHVRSVLEREEIEAESPDMVIISREIKRAGRSVARVNGTTTTNAVIQELGEALVDIHGQGDYLSLLKPETHLELIDRFAALEGDRAAFAKLVRRIEKVRVERRKLIQNEEALKARAEMLSFKVEEIAAADLKKGELETLQEEGKLLANAEQIAALVSDAYQALVAASEEGVSVLDLLADAAGALAKLSAIDGEATAMADMAEELSVQAEELASQIADYQDNIEFDPVRLQQVELRIDLIKTLMRRYDEASVEALLEAAQDAAAELKTIRNSDERITELEAEEARLLVEIGEAGAALSARRAEAGAELSRLVEEHLADLRMDRARFSVAVEQQDDPEGAPVGDYRVAFDVTGIDRIEFMLAPNPGEPFKPMAKIASGGETSRIMLALKTVLSNADDTPTLIFDEIDTGIGGRIGAIVGQKLWSLSDAHQVLVVTHLPQLAGFADAHFKVEKQTDGDRTLTHVYPLEPDLRVDELAQMLGAETGSSRQNAQDILAYVQQIKRAASPAG
ncbi:MAG: DNA repair protein RecN [Chloroflexi bacterium]|nr:DNA repair protein RecN [Chloroflexota bacterium]